MFNRSGHRQDADMLESINQFSTNMAVIARGPAPIRPEQPGVMVLRHLVMEATRPMREIQAAHADPINHLPILPDHGAVQLQADQISQPNAHDVGVIVRPFGG